MKKEIILKKLKQTDKITVICLTISFLSLAIGLMPYLFVRTSSTHISSFINYFFNFQIINLDKNGFLYSFLTCFFSDFWWAFSMPFSIFIFTKRKFSKSFYVFVTPVIGSILELCQFFDVIDGVGDIIDAVIYFSASFLGCTIIERRILKCQTDRKNQQKNTSEQ